MLSQGLRRWPNIEPMLGQFIAVVARASPSYPRTNTSLNLSRKPQTAVTAYLKSKQLTPFVFGVTRAAVFVPAGPGSCLLISRCCSWTARQLTTGQTLGQARPRGGRGVLFSRVVPLVTDRCALARGSLLLTVAS